MEGFTTSVIELGGGGNPRFCKKYGNGINLDVRPMETVDIIADFEKPFPLPSNEYGMVYSAYCIEHVSWRKISQFISEIYRILRPNGQAIIITANLLEQAKVLVNKGAWDLNDLCMIFGDLDYPENSHKSSMSPELATRLFREAGFQTINISPLPTCQSDMVIEVIK